MTKKFFCLILSRIFKKNEDMTTSEMRTQICLAGLLYFLSYGRKSIFASKDAVCGTSLKQKLVFKKKVKDKNSLKKT